MGLTPTSWPQTATWPCSATGRWSSSAPTNRSSGTGSHVWRRSCRLRSREPEREELELRIDRDSREGFGSDGKLTLRDFGLPRLQAVAHALAKSTVLAHYELRVAEAFSRVEARAQAVQPAASRRRIRELLREIRSALAMQVQTVGRVEMTEKPEMVWEDAALDSLYERLAAEFELRDRDAALNAEARADLGQRGHVPGPDPHPSESAGGVVHRDPHRRGDRAAGLRNAPEVTAARGCGVRIPALRFPECHTPEASALESLPQRAGQRVHQSGAAGPRRGHALVHLELDPDVALGPELAPQGGDQTVATAAVGLVAAHPQARLPLLEPRLPAPAGRDLAGPRGIVEEADVQGAGESAEARNEAVDRDVHDPARTRRRSPLERVASAARAPLPAIARARRGKGRGCSARRPRDCEASG